VTLPFTAPLMVVKRQSIAVAKSARPEFGHACGRDRDA
jgi:hypothetical protein